MSVVRAVFGTAGYVQTFFKYSIEYLSGQTNSSQMCIFLISSASLLAQSCREYTWREATAMGLPAVNRLARRSLVGAPDLAEDAARRGQRPALRLAL